MMDDATADAGTRRGLCGTTAAATSGPAAGIAVAVHASLDAIAPQDWNALCPGDVEDWHFYRALQDVPPAGVTLGAVTAHRGEALVAAAPLFTIAYRLDTPFQGALRRLTDRVSARWPRITSLPVLAVGS